MEKFADRYEDGKFTCGFFSSQFARTGACNIPPLCWENTRDKNFTKIAEYARKYRRGAIFFVFDRRIRNNPQTPDRRENKVFTTAKILPALKRRAYLTRRKSGARPWKQCPKCPAAPRGAGARKGPRKSP